mmetsp:Transcript_69648/g.163015  ORF Transcript_69648/g.163015 Transcript_69648/m.163015 type:complete len:134 (+) Transcript_69648:67-468(+)
MASKGIQPAVTVTRRSAIASNTAIPPDKGRSLPPQPRSGGIPKKAICGRVGFCFEDWARDTLDEAGRPAAGFGARGLVQDVVLDTDFRRGSSDEASEDGAASVTSLAGFALMSVDHASMAAWATSGDAGAECE